MTAASSQVLNRVNVDESSTEQQTKKEILGSAVFSAAVLAAIYIVGILFWGMGRMNGTW